MITSIGRARSFAAKMVVGAALCAACAGAAEAAGFDPPPIAAMPGTEHHVGKVIWAELITPDLASARKFYAGLLGWTFQDMSTGDTQYAIALANGERVGGIVQHPIKAGVKRQPSWLTFIAVQDVDATTRLARSSGGTVVQAPRTYNSRGRQAILRDPQGAAFAIMASYSADPADFLAAPGEWIWSSLLASDAGTDAAFYQTLFGYEVYDLESEDGQEHVILSTDNYARAGVNTLPADAVRRHPRWLNFVRVADAAGAAARTVALGGSVLVPPRVDRHGGRIAVLADPSGAAFGVMEWTETDSKEAP
jgi:uncharacterized protein